MNGACRAQALAPEAAAFLGALAIGESDPGVTGSDAVYSVLFGDSHFLMAAGSPGAPAYLAILTKEQGWPYKNPIKVWPAAFPAWDGVEIGGAMTHAAGRYQFEPRTWAGRQAKLRLPDFSPVSQDLAAWDLAQTVYRRVTDEDLLSDLQSGDLADIAGSLHSTWTSLSAATFGQRFRQCSTSSST